MKIYFKLKCLRTAIRYLFFGLIVSSSGPWGQNLYPSTVTAQPFMNSLAVLFRARPPWPTTFPPGNNNRKTFQVFQNSIPKNPPGPIPAPLLPSSGVKQGILVAHPLPKPPPGRKHPQNRPGFGQPKPNRHHNFPNLPIHQPPPPPPKHHHFLNQLPNQHLENQPPNQYDFVNQQAIQPSEIQHNFVNQQAIQPSEFQHNFVNQPSENQHNFVNQQSIQPLENQQMINSLPMQASSNLAGNFHFPELPSPPHFQSMMGGEPPPPPIFNNWQLQSDSKEFQSNQGQKALDFRPSPQLMDISNGYHHHHQNGFTKSREVLDGKLNSQFQAGEAKRLPRYESGFQPITSFNQINFNPATTTSPPYRFQENYYNPWSPPANNHFNMVSITPYQDDRKIVNAEVSKSVVTTDFSVSEEGKVNEPPDFGNKMASSSERVEDWISSQKTKQSSGEKFKFPVYKKRVRPIKCDKFHRYGFCPVTSNYPLSQVEKIASRCSALLSHLIAPLPKTDVHYDIVVTRNGSFRGRSASSRRRGWSWKDYRGRPICDTEEIKIVPGWAKNEDGDWLVVLQTHDWKQEAQVSICSPPGSHIKCFGESCEKSSSPYIKNTKCVQRFTAQRLAVLDPESQDRCPVVRSVFLPSACVCLSDDDHSEGNIFASSTESLEPIDDNSRGSSSEFVPVVLAPGSPHSSSNNGTYMIVSEKYSTKESSVETTAFP